MRVNYTNVGIAILLVVALFVFFKLSQLSQSQAVTHQDLQGTEKITGAYFKHTVWINDYARVFL